MSYTPDYVFFFTVDENGVITADGGRTGMADLFVSARYNGDTYTETLRVRVRNDVDFPWRPRRFIFPPPQTANIP